MAITGFANRQKGSINDQEAQTFTVKELAL